MLMSIKGLITKAPVPANTEDCIEDGFPTSIVHVSPLECGVVIS